MAKSKQKQQSVRPSQTLTPKAPTLRQWLGVAIGLLAVVGLAASANNLLWQLQTRLLYTEGVCRVVSARVAAVGSGFELDIEHQVEANGRMYRPTRNTDQATPWYRSRDEAEAALAEFAIGTHHPCWYAAADPDRHSVLIRRDMDTLTQSALFGASLALGAIGLWLTVGRTSRRG